MALPNVFDSVVAGNLINRINKLTPATPAQWGKMNVAQMLAHCNVTYEMVYEKDKHPAATGFKKMILKWLVKPMVTNEKPYKKNGHTAPQFIITDARIFETEKNRLASYIQQTQKMGESHFDSKEANSFGVLNSTEWNNMFYKHLDHHLTQFGA